MWRVEELLRKATRALNASGAPYAIVGGNAVAAWVTTVDPDAVRATKDVDILARRADLARLAESLLKIGFIQEEVLGVNMFLDQDDPSPKRGIHVVIANEFIRPNYAHPAPDVIVSQDPIAEYPVIDLPELLMMKLQSYRPVDQTHVIDMLGVGLITKEIDARLPPDLRGRLDEVRRIAEDSL